MLNAIASATVSGVSAPCIFLYGLGIIPAIVGVVLGYAARRQIRRNGEAGIELATAGLAIGWSVIGLTAILAGVVAYLVFVFGGAGE